VQDGSLQGLDVLTGVTVHALDRRSRFRVWRRPDIDRLLS
jgi:hypothetical protein